MLTEVEELEDDEEFCEPLAVEAAGEGADEGEVEQEVEGAEELGELSSRQGIHSRPRMRLSSSVCLLLLL